MKITTLKINVFIMITILFFSSGCVTPGGITSSSTPIQNREYEVLGKEKGKSNYSGAIFGLWTIGTPDLNVAIKDAVKKKNGDAMINVQWYERTYYFVLFSLHRVYVVGDIIKFKGNENKEILKVKKENKIKKKVIRKRRTKKTKVKKGR